MATNSGGGIKPLRVQVELVTLFEAVDNPSDEVCARLSALLVPSFSGSVDTESLLCHLVCTARGGRGANLVSAAMRLGADFLRPCVRVDYKYNTCHGTTTPLVRAVELGESEIVAAMLSSVQACGTKKDFDFRDDARECTALQVALQNGEREAAQLLLVYGASTPGMLSGVVEGEALAQLAKARRLDDFEAYVFYGVPSLTPFLRLVALLRWRWAPPPNAISLLYGAPVQETDHEALKAAMYRAGYHHSLAFAACTELFIPPPHRGWTWKSHGYAPLVVRTAVRGFFYTMAACDVRKEEACHACCLPQELVHYACSFFMVHCCIYATNLFNK